MRCLPSTDRSSPLTMVRIASVAAYKSVKMPPRDSSIVKVRPAAVIGWTSRKPTVVIVMTVM